MSADNEAPDRVTLTPFADGFICDAPSPSVASCKEAGIPIVYARVDPPTGKVPCKALGYSYDNPPPRDKQWCVTHGQSMGSCAAMTKVAERDAATAKQIVKRYLDDYINDYQLESQFATALATVRQATWQAAIGWAKKVQTVKLDAARDASTNDEYAAVRLSHEADGAKRVVETLESAAKQER